jgi:CheY-like chemotaxis protein
MVMAINRAIEFRKTAAGLSLLASNETFHLSKAVEWAVDRFSSNPSGVPIRVEMGPVFNECCPFLITDKHWMTENILTLLSNACKFTSKGEIVLRMALIAWEGDPMLKESCLNDALSIEGKVATYRRVTAEWMADHPDENVCVHIEVEDTGIGVSPESVHKLFRPFGNIQQGAGGTGLGLFSLAKRTEVLEGRCGMHKRGDGASGCCFWFNFPYVPDAIAWQDSNSASDTNSHTDVMKAQLLKGNLSNDMTLTPEDNVANTGQKDLSNKVVLVVDDSSLILKTTSRMLVKEGFEVETAQNGEEALKLMRSNLYLFVLSDIQMPVMDGLEMAQRLRQLEKDNATSGNISHRPQHIVGMSANSDAETRDDSLSSGMNSFIPKPVRIGELLKHLTHHIDNQV